MQRQPDRIERLYRAYNGRNLEALVQLVCDDVDWPDGARRLRGRAAVREYWRREWARVRTHDEVASVALLTTNRIAVRIRQVVRDHAGTVMSRGTFEHAYDFRDGLVARLDLRKLTDDPEHESMTHDALIHDIYDGFNRRDIPAVLAHLADDVLWTNGIDGGHVRGRDAVRAYWTAQWAAIQPSVEPLRIDDRGDGVVAVEVHQVVRDFAGALLLDETVTHVFTVAGGRIARFDIEHSGGLSTLAHC